jgi:hypothetical protein
MSIGLRRFTSLLLVDENEQWPRSRNGGEKLCWFWLDGRWLTPMDDCCDEVRRIYSPTVSAFFQGPPLLLIFFMLFFLFPTLSCKTQSTSWMVFTFSVVYIFFLSFSFAAFILIQIGLVVDPVCVSWRLHCSFHPWSVQFSSKLV